MQRPAVPEMLSMCSQNVFRPSSDDSKFENGFDQFKEYNISIK